MTPDQVIAALGLEPLPVEGGLFHQTWRGPEDSEGNPSGTSIVAMYTDDTDSFSAIHRLPTTEIWHFQLGDPIRMLLLWPNGTVTEPVLGPNLMDGDQLTVIVPPGVWMGADLVPGGRYGVFACTMAPGFTSSDYEGGDADGLSARFPSVAARIRRLHRPHESTTRMPPGL